MIRVPWKIDCGLVGCSHDGEFEIDDEEWDGMTDAEREKILTEMLNDEMGNYIDASCGKPVRE